MEMELLKWLRENFPIKSPDGSIGIGDDAAVVGSDNRRIVLTSDAIIENVHFDNKMTFEQIGRKALAVNLSDLASMAAEPKNAIVNLCLPSLMPIEDVKRLYQGMSPLLDEFGLQIIGGDTNVGSSELMISITAIGLETEFGVWRLDSAKAGDRIVVSGSFGGSRNGKHYNFRPRCDLALRLNQHYEIDAGTDVSDGLSLDLFRMAEASQLGFTIHASKIPIADSVTGETVADRVASALGDGEDFELIIAVPESEISRVMADEQFGSQLTEIGLFDNSLDGVLFASNGDSEKMTPSGFVH